MIDLHLHSTASDGALAPADVVRRAHEKGLTAVALTDHDTVAGIAEAAEEGGRLGIEVIPGVEVSLDHEPGTFHLLGLFIDTGNDSLTAALSRVRHGRDDRNERIVRRLCELGMPVRLEEVIRIAGDGVVGRPHLARILVEKGYVSSVKDAFERYLGKGRTAYVDRTRLTAAEAIPLVQGAGGVTVLCHPFTLGLPAESGPGGLLEFVRRLAGYGLDAIEVGTSEHSPDQEAACRGIAKELDLLESGGSDFHGLTPRSLQAGPGVAGAGVPDEVLERLRERSLRYAGPRP